MGRTSIEDKKKIQVGSRVDPLIREALKRLAAKDRRTVSQVIEMLLDESPTLQAEMQNGRSAHAKT